jgi:hypothetical protein
LKDNGQLIEKGLGMSKIIDGGPAFPQVAEMEYGLAQGDSGMSKREYFAGLAMQAIIASQTTIKAPYTITDTAVCAADALLAELAKGDKQ